MRVVCVYVCERGTGPSIVNAPALEVLELHPTTPPINRSSVERVSRELRDELERFKSLEHLVATYALETMLFGQPEEEGTGVWL